MRRDIAQFPVCMQYLSAYVWPAFPKSQRAFFYMRWTLVELDSVGRSIRTGDKVRFRGNIYTIAKFHPGEGCMGTARITFTESEIHTDEPADEISVDRVTGGRNDDL